MWYKERTITIELINTKLFMKETKQNLALPIAIVVAGVLIAGAVLYSGKEPSPATEEIPNTEETVIENPVIEQKDEILSLGHARGSENAPITLVEFSDPECPYCAHYHATMDTVYEEYGESGDLAWHYVHLFPFDARPDVHPNARAQAEAAECAGAVGGDEKFWEFMSAVFAADEPRDMEKIATNLSLDITAFNACIENGDFAESVDTQHSFAYDTLGLRGTPHSVVILQDGTGYKINGAYPIDTVAITIEAALAGVGAGKIQAFLDMFQDRTTTEESINAYVQSEFIPAIQAAQETQ